MANPRLIVINFRDLVGFSNAGTTRDVYFPPETKAALVEMMTDPDTTVVIASAKDEEKELREVLSALFVVLPKNMLFSGMPSVASASAVPFILQVAEDQKRKLMDRLATVPASAVASAPSSLTPSSAASAAASAPASSPAPSPVINPEIIVIDSHTNVIKAAIAKNIVPILVPIPINRKRPLSPNYLFTAARVGSYADDVKVKLNDALANVKDRESSEPLRKLDVYYKNITGLQMKTDNKLKECQDACLQFNQAKAQAPTYAACLEMLADLEMHASAINDKKILDRYRELKRDLDLQQARKLEAASEASIRIYAGNQKVEDYQNAKQFLQQAKELCARSEMPHFQLELLALELYLLRRHQQVLIDKAVGGSCIREQLTVVQNFKVLHDTHKNSPAVNVQRLSSKVQPELDALKQILVTYFLTKMLPGAATGQVDGVSAEDMYQALKDILEFERDVMVRQKIGTQEEAAVLAHLRLDAQIRTALKSAGDAGANRSFFVIFAQELMTLVSQLTAASIKSLFSKTENLNPLFALLDAAYQECLKYQSALSVPQALAGKNLAKLMHDIVHCKLNILKESREVSHLYVIGRENTLTEADGKPLLCFPETSVPMLKGLLSNPSAIVVFVSDSAEFADYQALIATHVGPDLAAKAVYLPKSYLQSKAIDEYMGSEIARSTVKITEAAEVKLYPVANQQSIDDTFINDVLKQGDFVLTKEQSNWILVKKNGGGLERVVIEGRVAEILDSMKAVHPATITQSQKDTIESALKSLTVSGSVDKSLSNFPVVVISERIRQQLGIRQPENLTLVHGDFRTVFAASQIGISAIWTAVVPPTHPEQLTPNALALVPLLSALRSVSEAATLYQAVSESFVVIDQTTSHQQKSSADALSAQQNSLGKLNEKYASCLVGKKLAADSLAEGKKVLGIVKVMKELPDQRAYEDAYNNTYNLTKKALLQAITYAKMLNDKNTLFEALICFADLSNTWHFHATKAGEHSYRLKANDYIYELLTLINQADLGQLIAGCTDKILLEKFKEVLLVTRDLVGQAKTGTKLELFRGDDAASRLTTESNLINLTLPKVEARLQVLNPTGLKGLFSSLTGSPAK